jgi:hypothetical protein
MGTWRRLSSLHPFRRSFELGSVCENSDMPEPFESSRGKIDRAKVHIANLESKIRQFCEAKPYGRSIEPISENPNELAYKIKLTNSMPQGLPAIVGDAVNNLRNSLDHALLGSLKFPVASIRITPTSRSPAPTPNLRTTCGEGAKMCLSRFTRFFGCSSRIQKGMAFCAL